MQIALAFLAGLLLLRPSFQSAYEGDNLSSFRSTKNLSSKIEGVHKLIEALSRKNPLRSKLSRLTDALDVQLQDCMSLSGMISKKECLDRYSSGLDSPNSGFTPPLIPTATDVSPGRSVATTESKSPKGRSNLTRIAPEAWPAGNSWETEDRRELFSTPRRSRSTSGLTSETVGDPDLVTYGTKPRPRRALRQNAERIKSREVEDESSRHYRERTREKQRKPRTKRPRIDEDAGPSSSSENETSSGAGERRAPRPTAKKRTRELDERSTESSRDKAYAEEGSYSTARGRGHTGKRGRRRSRRRSYDAEVESSSGISGE